MHKTDERKGNYGVKYFNGEFHSLVIGDFCARIIPPGDLHVPFTCIIGSPAILFLAIMFALFYTFLYIHKLCQEKNTCSGKTTKIESQNTFLCERAERASDFWSF